MKPRTLALTVALCLLGAMLGAASPAAGKPSQDGSSAGSLLFVQQTKGGELDRIRTGVYRLVFRDVSPTVATFTDRPRRRAGEQGLTRFVKSWAANGFAADPPNAALVLRGAPSSRDVAMLTLSHPRYDRVARTLTYTAKPLRDPGATSLAGFTRRGDRLRSLSFGAASLFVDDAGSNTNFVPMNLLVTGNVPDQQASIEITTPGVYWSLGRVGRNSGLVMNTQPAAQAPSNLTITGSTLAFRTPAEEASVGFVLSLFVETPASNDVLEFTSAIGEGIEIQASLGASPPFTISSGNGALPLEGF